MTLCLYLRPVHIYCILYNTNNMLSFAIFLKLTRPKPYLGAQIHFCSYVPRLLSHLGVILYKGFECNAVL